MPRRWSPPEFGRFHAGAYPANRVSPLFDPPRAETLADRFGWDPDPATAPGAGTSVAIEVYPHPAMVLLFGLATVLPYKAKRGRTSRACGPRSRAARPPRAGVRPDPAAHDVAALGRDPGRRGAAARIGELDRVEDEVDAVLCAYLAWLWGTGYPGMRVLGDVTTGYIVVPGRAAG